MFFQRKIFIILGLLCSFISLNAQNFRLNFLNDAYSGGIYYKLDSIKNFHTSVRPYIFFSKSDINCINENLSRHSKLFPEKKGRLLNKVFNTHLIRINKNDYELIIDPLFNFQLGNESREGKN